MTVPRLSSKGRFDAVRLFHPESVALLGLETEEGAQIMGNLTLAGFKGQMRTRLEPGTHLAVLALPSDRIGPAMEEMTRFDCFAAIVPGPCDDLAAHCARTGVRALGPHSFGLAIPSLSLNATRSHIQPPPGRLAVISQSSAMTRAVIDWAGPNGVGFSYIVGVGANAGIGFSLALDWLSRDTRTGAILLDIRRLKNHRQFLSAARAAARLRPVVAIRPGLRLEDGDGVGDLAFEAALRRAGVLYVERLEDLLAAAETLSRAKPVRGDTLAIVTNAIGPGRLAADSAMREGLRLLPEGLSPVPTETLSQAAFAAAAQPDTGGILVVHAPIGAADAKAIEGLCHPPPGLRTPILICALGETVGAIHRRTLAQAGLPVFATPDQAVRGFAHLARDRRNREAARELPPRDVLTLAPDKAWVKRLFAGSARVLTQDQALDVLAAYGIPSVPTRVVTGPDDAASAAALLGYPAVVKQRSSLPPPERRAGGVVFDLHEPEGVVAAARLLAARARRRLEDEALLVQRQAGRGRELAIRVFSDPTFGPVIAFGPGGTMAHTGDTAIDLPPLNLALARGLIHRCRAGSALSRSLRDQTAANETAVSETLVRVSQLIVDFPEIAELYIPALFADSRGVLAVDAWLRLRAPEEPPVSLAIAPYPANLIEHRMVGDDPVTIRPVRPEDALAHTAFFGRLSPEDIRFRFFSAMRELSPELTARLTQVDYDREMAFIAVKDGTNETIGVARLTCEVDHEGGEFAVIVQADMKGRGLASHLMCRLIDWARTQGLKRVVGQILSDNAPMLAFVRHLGFEVHRMPDDPEVMEAVLAL
ncbi:MAG TPA: GNAT family N-acetyltransferase [Rhodopila sp.]|uniref:bifunctional acetate--CoA ligase family protein/GNAT family N-acetyltransferase n=1 Tax=Rhodopila sp. TaxID=2480087 RepID=UPI002B5ECFC5|nr:GNAT family N-acetyltransferase [Rhodopila sp.]HVY14001.1 GNAT family N-acetyltransferase [Rhodopila sp.]